jgi:hypothetical protein
VFTGCRLYRVAWKDGAIEDWVLAPNYGFVQYGTFAGAFVFDRATLMPYVEQPPVSVPSPCPVPGVDANPDSGSGFGETAIRAGLQKAHAAGARLINIDTTWSELEPVAGSYNFTRVLRLMSLADAQGLQVMLNIATVDTFMFWTPPDLGGRSIGDAVVSARFQALLRRLAPQIRPNVEYVHLANEVDIYLSEQPRIAEFRSFFSGGAAALKQLRPELSIGFVSAYNNTRRTDAIFQAIKDLGDHTAFTYYPLGDQYAHRKPAAPAVDVPDMVRLAGGRAVVLSEIGYSSSPAVNGSDLKQQEFYNSVFAALKRVGNRVAVANFLFMNELPATSVRALSEYYGPAADPRFIAYVGTLGLHDSTGAPKAAWAEFSAGAREMLVPNGCSRQ